jgi:hypothetical protein
MKCRLFAVMGLGLGVLVAAAIVAPTTAQEKTQEKKPTAAAQTKEDRIDGTVKSIDTKTKTISVRVRGKNMERAVIYDDKTKFTFRNKASSLDEVKGERRVICLGKLNDKGQLMATRIDVRDEM